MVSRELFTWPPPSAKRAPPLTRRLSEQGNCQLVSGDTETFSASTDIHPYPSNTSNIPDTNMNYDLAASLQQFQSGNAPHHLATLEYPYVDQPLTLRPYPATNTPLSNWQQSTSLPPNSPDPPSQSQEWTGLGLSDPSLRVNTSFGPPPEAATTSLLRAPVGESGPLVTDLPTR